MAEDNVSQKQVSCSRTPESEKNLFSFEYAQERPPTTGPQDHQPTDSPTSPTSPHIHIESKRVTTGRTIAFDINYGLLCLKI